MMKIVSLPELREVFYDRVPEYPRVATGSHATTPWDILREFDGAISQYRMFLMNPRVGIPNRPGVIIETPFMGAGSRHRKNVRYYPCHLSMVPQLLTEELPVDVVLVQTSRVIDGRVSLGPDVVYLPSLIMDVHKRGGLVVAQINQNLPYTFGEGEIVTGIFDYAVEADLALYEVPESTPDDQTLAIAHNVAPLVPNGATLQGGIGGVVETVMELLDGSDYQVMSEMISDWTMKLEEGGKLSANHISATFAIGSKEFYEWLDLNPRIWMIETKKANNPRFIASFPKVVSINTAFEVDLHDQANAFFIKGDWYSGFGGALDFTIGAELSTGGLSILALPSWREKTGTSSIVNRLSNPTTTLQHSYVVTEYGTAKMFGATAEEQADRLIEVAHPEMKASLRACHKK